MWTIPRRDRRITAHSPAGFRNFALDAARARVVTACTDGVVRAFALEPGGSGEPLFALDAHDGPRTKAGTEHGEPRDRSQRRSAGIPGERGGCVGVATGQTAEAL